MKILKIAALFLMIVGFLCCSMAYVYIDLSYASKMPIVPDPETGRTHRIEVSHGSVRYVTKQELDRAGFVSNKLFPIGFVFFAGAAVIAAFWDKLG